MVAMSPSQLKKINIDLDAEQRAFMADKSPVKVGCWHRQKGKDFTTAGDAVLDAAEKGSTWYIVSMTQRQADETFDKCKFWSRYLQQEVRDLIREEESSPYIEYDAEIDQYFTHRSRTLHLPNGGKVVSLPGRDPDTLAGFTGNIIFTEFGLFPKGGYTHWRVVFPLITRGYRIIVISTPRGKDTKFYELVNNPETFSVHFCDIYQSVAGGFKFKDDEGNTYTLEEFKALYDDEVGWQREYECKFMGALDALLRWAQLEAAAAAGAGLPFDYLKVKAEAGWADNFFAALRNGDFLGRAEMGWDVARRGHLSALWINDGTTELKRLRYLVLMDNCSFALQREIVTAAMDSQQTAVGCGDSTGLGMDSNETLATKYADRWEPVNFGGKRKSDLGSGLATAFKDQAQTLPDLDAHKFIATDLYAVQREAAKESVGEDGKSQLKLVESQNPLMTESHCDIAYSGALALRAGHMIQLAAPGITSLGDDDEYWGSVA